MIWSAMYEPSASKSADGCRSLAGLEKSVSSGQKIGHIIGCPKRLICRQPPASVASFVAHQTPDAGAGAQPRDRRGRPRARSTRRWCRRSCSSPCRRSTPTASTAGAVVDGRVDGVQLGEVDVERIADASGPDPYVVLVRRLAGHAGQDLGAGRAVVARLGAGQGVHGHRLPAVRAGLVEGQPVGQVLVARRRRSAP